MKLSGLSLLGIVISSVLAALFFKSNDYAVVGACAFSIAVILLFNTAETPTVFYSSTSFLWLVFAWAAIDAKWWNGIWTYLGLLLGVGVMVTGCLILENQISPRTKQWAKSFFPQVILWTVLGVSFYYTLRLEAISKAFTVLLIIPGVLTIINRYLKAKSKR